MEQALDKNQILKLSIVFALIYFFSINGLASLPGITISFLLKDVLKMTATQAAYFGAVTLVGWAIKPIWGLISDLIPIFGYRRKSYLIITATITTIVWVYLGQVENFSIKTLLILFTLSSTMYAFMDVICDGLMVETGKPYNITGQLQSIQWTSVYIAAIITGLVGGWVAKNLAPQTVFLITGMFPVLILLSSLFIKETKVINHAEHLKLTVVSLKKASRTKTIWLLALFLFLWTFSPSFGAPFFYYAVDVLKFDQIFLGIVATVGAASSAVGAILYARYVKKIKTRVWINVAIFLGVIATLFDLIYFTQLVQQNLALAKALNIATAAILSVIGSITFLMILNAAALACPKNGEGTTFATLTSFWNIGLIGSSILGGFLFEKIGLQPLIITSAVFTAAAWIVLPHLQFADDDMPVA